MKLLIGCPIAFRAWAVASYMAHLKVACERAGLEPNFVFVGDPLADSDTWAAIAEHGPGPVQAVAVPEYRTEDVRDWCPPRYERMATLRNVLLAAVRAAGPEMFLSLDSDILVHPQVLMNLVESLERFDVVGAKCYMSPGTACPSYAMLPYGGGLRRPDMAGGVVEVDVAMGCVLLGPSAYAIDYGTHEQGEDIQFCINLREAGLKIGWDNRVCSKHVMNPMDLVTIDVRCGF